MLKKIALAFIVCIVVGYCYITRKKSVQGMVIILNGPSASGKSSIQKEFQKLMMPNLWIKLGIDNLFDGPLPDITLENMAYWQLPNSIRWVDTGVDQEGQKTIDLHVGEEGKKVFYGMHQAIVAYAQAGCHCIVDYIAYEPALFEDLQARLKKAHVPVVYVAVDISLEELEAREKARGTSPVGHARSHYNHVYGTLQYDLRVDSGKNSAATIAREIKEFLSMRA